MLFLKKYTLFILLVIILTLGGFLFATSNLGFDIEKSTSASVDEYAQAIVETCSSAEYRPTCYEEEVPKLLTEMPSSEIFNVIRAIRSYDQEYLFCHVVAHELGRYEVSLDPDNWLDVIAKGPTDGLCSNGFAHGAIVTRFNEGKLPPAELEYALKDLAIACETREGWDPTDLTQAMCYHGIGHVLVHMTEADVNTSLSACEQVALKGDGRDYRKLCTEGVYMQLFQPLEPEDYALIDQLPVAPSRENIATFCATESNNNTQYGACWREAWPFFYEELFDPEGVLNYCGALSDAQGREECFVTAFTINGRQNLGNPDEMAQLCNALPLSYQGTCFARGANAFPEEDPQLIPQAIDMCSRAEQQEAADECYGFLASVATFNFHPNSESHQLLCSSLPKKWQEECL